LAIADRLNWRYAPLDAEVVYAGAVLETIRHEAVDGLSRLAHGGLEIGGILLGRRTDRSMEIVAALPLECEHKLGPLFILSAADEKSLEAALTSDKLGALQPVGLYVSHSRRGFSVAETDAKILDRLIPGPWQLVLVVMPVKIGATRAGFFIRGSVVRSFVCAHEVLLSRGEHRLLPAATAAPIAPIVLNPSPVIRPAAAVRYLRSLLAQVRKHWRLSQWNMATTVALLLLFISVGGLWVRARAVSSPAVRMHLSDLGSELRIEWDPAQKAVRTASAATLEIRDGGRKPIEIPITRSGLDNGTVLYVPQADNIEVRLKLMHTTGAPSESVIYFINPSRQQEVAELKPVSEPVVARAAEPVAARGAEPAAETLPEPPSEPSAQSVPENAEKPVSLQPSSHEKPVRKTFQLPVVEVANAATRPGIALPDLPEIPADDAPGPMLPAANGSAIAAFLASPVRSAGPPLLRTGRLIWTGTLHKSVVLTITPAGASSGVLSGRLPGFPVTIRVQPAELVDSGIAVYSKDGDRSGASEPPSAWNGWNVTVFHDWDPKRIAEVTLVEPPGPANNWQRLVVRGGNRNVSVFVVTWQR
jgi:hypothetical protein